MAAATATRANVVIAAPIDPTSARRYGSPRPFRTPCVEPAPAPARWCEAAWVGLTEWISRVAQAFDIVGAAVLVAGFVWSVVAAARDWARRNGKEAFRTLRTTFGGALLLGLEVLVAADLVRTVAVAPTLDNVVVLAIIVAIRTFLSFSLQVEIEGTLPWRRDRRPDRQVG
jgi:uncharacterized membrane protein